MYSVVKSEVILACRACLATTGQLFSINNHRLNEAFVQLTGTQVFEADGLPQFLCVFCRAMVVKFAQFRNKTQTSQSLLVTILLEQQFVTTEHLKNLDRQSYNLIAPWHVEQLQSVELIPTAANNEDVKLEVINIINTEQTLVTNEIQKACLINKNIIEMQPNKTPKVNDNRYILDIKNEQNKNEEFSINQESDCSDDINLMIHHHLDYEESDKIVEKAEENKLIDSKVHIKPKVNNKNKTKAISSENIPKSKMKQKKEESMTKANNEINKKRRKSRSIVSNEIKKNKEEGASKVSKPKQKTINKSNFETKELWFWFENEQKKTKFEKEFNFKVNILTKEEQFEAIQAKKFDKNYTDSPFKCDLCYRGYLNEEGYKNHMLLHVVKQAGDVVCEICNQRFILNKNMIKHQMIHRVRLQCNECGYITSDKARSMEHYRAHQGRKFECEHCGKSFKLKPNYYTHVRFQHPSKLLPCDVCGEGFCGEFGLMMHKKKHEMDEVVKKKSSIDHRCCTCGIQFPSFEAWNVHTQIDIEHSCTTLTRPCLDCGLNFVDEESLQQHAKTHKQLYPCNACDMSFPSELSRNTHYERKHLNVKRKHLECDQVRQYYKNYKKKYKGKSMCEICGKKFASEAALLTHQRSHTGDRPFECSVCQKRFQAKINLKTHMVIHTGERPFQCELCPKAFSKKVTLNIHQRVHTGVRPYTCTCGKSFKQSNSLKLHMMTVHLKQPAPYKSKKRQQRQQERLQGKSDGYCPTNHDTVVS